MNVTETIKMLDGREITISLTEVEYNAIMAAGINFLIAKGFLSLSDMDHVDVISIDEVREELEAAEKEANNKDTPKH